MAKYECTVNGNFSDFSRYIHDEIMNGSISASYEDGCTCTSGNTRTEMSVFERYSYAGGNRVSLSVLLTQTGDDAIRVCAVTSGGSQAMFFKLNTWGEESFLDRFREAVERYKG